MEWLLLIGGIGLVILYFWAPFELLHKAGYSRWWALLFSPIGPVGMMVFAFLEWPVHRELAWRRLATGSDSARDFDMAQGYAVDLEKAGEWRRAIEAHELLARRSPDEASAKYAADSIRRLQASLDRESAA